MRRVPTPMATARWNGAEAAGGYLNSFDSMDTDGDGSLSGAEINAATVPLDVTYTEQMMLTLGDSTVELHHPSAAPRPIPRLSCSRMNGRRLRWISSTPNDFRGR